MLNSRQTIFLLILVLLWVPSRADTVYRQPLSGSMVEAVSAVSAALEEERLWVVFEANIAASMARFEKRWGEDYNRSALQGLHSLVVCNPFWANAVANADPNMLALCPLRVAIVQRDGPPVALFARPTVIGADSPALAVLQQLEQKIVTALRAAAEQLAKSER